MLKNIANPKKNINLQKIFIMKEQAKNIKIKKAVLKDYNRIVVSREIGISTIEWSQKGDAFKKLSVYNKSYKTVPTLTSNVGTTILLKNLV